MLRKTALHSLHAKAGARMVPFGGWDMPLHYGSQLEEHHAVRTRAGVFDVSHMTVVDVAGEQSRQWLQRLLANDVARLNQPGCGLYSCMLNEQGGVVDDLIVYWMGEDRYRLVVNAATRDADLAWMNDALSGFAARLTERTDLAMLAVQGPVARELAATTLPSQLAAAVQPLPRFAAAREGEVFVARTGYTGEDGWEILLPGDQVAVLWTALLAAGVRPCGLGARDTLRLEAGLNLYGQDMTTRTSPLISNLAWTVAWEPATRQFIGREALERERTAGLSQRLVGLVLGDRGIMRAHQPVHTSAGVGEVTSGGFSPTLQRSIALARVPVAADEQCEVEIRANRVVARIVRTPFVRNGKKNQDSGDF